MIEIKSFFLLNFRLGGHANLLCKLRLAKVESENERGSSDLRGTISKELFISLHKSAKLACHVIDLRSFCFVVVESKDELISLEERNGRHEVKRELESSDNLFLKADQGLLGDKEALSIGKEANHDVEGGMHWLLELCGHQEACHSERDKTWCLLSFDCHIHKVSVGNADCKEKSVNLVSLVSVQVFDENNHSLSLSCSDRQSLSMSGDVRTNSILLTQHGLIGSLRVLWSELAFCIVVHSWTTRRSVLHVNSWYGFTESLLPALVHLLGRTRKIELRWGVLA